MSEYANEFAGSDEVSRETFIVNEAWFVEEDAKEEFLGKEKSEDA